MSLIPGKYKLYKNDDNLDEYFTAVGVPFLMRKMILKAPVEITITVNGDTVTIKTSASVMTTEVTFKFGEDYIEKVLERNIHSKTTKINDREIETVGISENSKKKTTTRYLFSEDECVLTLIQESGMSTKRYFKRVTE